jgi:photosystem II stability/assembly factor-like uncharacterized protein
MNILRKIFVAALLLCAASAANAEWQKQNLNTFAWFRDVFFLDHANGWIVGGDGVLISTSDGGTTWTQTRKFTADNFVQVHFTSATDGWILCERNVFNRGKEPVSYLRRTTDGGRTWGKVEFEDAGRERVTKLLFGKDGSARAFGEGGIFFKLQDDGVTWKRSKTAIHFVLRDGMFSDETIGAIVGAGGTIMFTEDGGLTWQKATLLGDIDTRFNAVYFAGRSGAWAVGTQGRIFRSTGGGRLWRQQNSTVTANLNDVWFTSDNNGWAVGDSGIIVRTRDGGKTWYDEKPPVLHKLERIVFHNGRGFAIGMGGTLLRYDDRSADPGTKPTLMKRS